MNPYPAPNPPVGLLARCLATIPDVATSKPVAPRLLPDAGSRKRLAWLALAAAVPAVTMFAVLPVREMMYARKISKSRKEVSASGLKFIKSTIWYYTTHNEGKDVDFGHVTGRLYLFHSEKGTYSAEDSVMSTETKDFSPTIVRSCHLTTSSDVIYERTKSRVKVSELANGAWKKEGANIKRQVQALSQSTEKTAVELLETFHQQPNGLRKSSSRDHTWEGKPARMYTFVNTLRPDDKRSAAHVRCEVYLARASNLPLAIRSYARWDDGVHKNKGEVLIGAANFSYAATPADERLLRPETILRGATQVRSIRRSSGTAVKIQNH